MYQILFRSTKLVAKIVEFFSRNAFREKVWWPHSLSLTHRCTTTAKASFWLTQPAEKLDFPQIGTLASTRDLPPPFLAEGAHPPPPAPKGTGKQEKASDSAIKGTVIQSIFYPHHQYVYENGA
jgi:hypothetical protein